MYMNIPWIVFILISDAKANDHHELVVLYSPPSLEYKGNKKTLENTVKDIYVSAFRLSTSALIQNEPLYGKDRRSGLPSQSGLPSRRMNVINPKHLPQAIIEVYIEGHPGYGGLPVSYFKNYILFVHTYLLRPHNALKPRLPKLLGVEKHNYINIDFSNKIQVDKNNKIFGEIKPAKLATPNYHGLKYDRKPDFNFLNELSYIYAVVNEVNPAKMFPNDNKDYYEINVRKVHGLYEAYGKEDMQIKEATSHLLKLIYDLREIFTKAYKGSMFIAVISMDDMRFKGELHLTTQSITHATTKKIEQLSKNDGNIAQPTTPSGGALGGEGEGHRPSPPAGIDHTGIPGDQGDQGDQGDGEGTTQEIPGGGSNGMGVDEDDPDFPLRFNLIFWFVLIYIYVLIATIYFVMRMKPDKDSIIYRMSNIRTKKEH